MIAMATKIALKNECRECDGAGRICYGCMNAADQCSCDSGADHHDCPVCEATGYEPDPNQDDEYVKAIMATSDADVLAGRFQKHPRDNR